MAVTVCVRVGHDLVRLLAVCPVARCESASANICRLRQGLGEGQGAQFVNRNVMGVGGRGLRLEYESCAVTPARSFQAEAGLTCVSKMDMVSTEPSSRCPSVDKPSPGVSARARVQAWCGRGRQRGGVKGEGERRGASSTATEGEGAAAVLTGVELYAADVEVNLR